MSDSTATLTTFLNQASNLPNGLDTFLKAVLHNDTSWTVVKGNVASTKPEEVSGPMRAAIPDFKELLEKILEEYTRQTTSPCASNYAAARFFHQYQHKQHSPEALQQWCGERIRFLSAVYHAKTNTHHAFEDPQGTHRVEGIHIPGLRQSPNFTRQWHDNACENMAFYWRALFFILTWIQSISQKHLNKTDARATPVPLHASTEAHMDAFAFKHVLDPHADIRSANPVVSTYYEANGYEWTDVPQKPNNADDCLAELMENRHQFSLRYLPSTKLYDADPNLRPDYTPTTHSTLIGR